ncbi:hypothetical protein [Novosphingobium sp. KACC 22771]|uniref:hypothetical protein n=1 Tax=Novosphingobium sp. KACC 22771 TaxID=3025670 RepID=UPI0023670C03|nr:hypothetical protein [Novosphingobium sp. KACC 22771]WDF72759.1 hypothetical protein PQ467_01580 [Novosphingobium sp. KACC 22771]
MTVRVHAFKPEFGGAPSLAAGNRLSLEAISRQDLTVQVPFHAIKGVEYALYGFFTEPTDLSVIEVEVELDEPEDGEDLIIEAPRSILAEPETGQESGPASGLIHIGALTPDMPVSQDCTWAQMESGASIASRITQWREKVCQTALSVYGVEIAGLDGWVIGDVSSAMESAMLSRPFTLAFRHGLPEEGGGEFADILLWPMGPQGDFATRGAELQSWLDRLKIGGFAVVGLNYRVDAEKSLGMARNDIRQWVFRLIGLGYSVAPLAFASAQDLAVDETGHATLCLIVRRQ